MTKHLTLLLFIGLVWGQESYNYSLPVDFPNFTINTSDTSDSSYVFLPVMLERARHLIII